MKKTRASNIELLRILTICGVVVLHYNGYYGFSAAAPDSVNFHILSVLEVLFICAVNLFVLISGYFLCESTQRKAIKVIELVVQVMVMGVVKYLLSILFDTAAFSLTGLIGAAVPNNYFVTFYLALYLLSPYINILVNKLSQKQFSVLLGLVLCLFSLWPTLLDLLTETGFLFSGLYTTNTAGSQFGYSILNFVMMYLLGAYLKKHPVNSAPWKCGAGFAVCVALLAFVQHYFPAIARAYSNPLVVAEAAFLFLLFQRLHFSSKLVNSLAAGTFTCFLLHDVFLPEIGIVQAVSAPAPLMIGHIILSVLLIFLACWVVWKIYHLISRPVYAWLDRKLTPVNTWLSAEETQER